MSTLGIGVTITLTATNDIIAGCDVIDVGDLSLTADDVETTVHGTSNIKTYMAGLVDLGDIQLTLEYNDDTTANALYAAMKAGTQLTAVLTYPEPISETCTFTAYINQLGQSTPTADRITQTIKLKLDGGTEPTWA